MKCMVDCRYMILDTHTIHYTLYTIHYTQPVIYIDVFVFGPNAQVQNPEDSTGQ